MKVWVTSGFSLSHLEKKVSTGSLPAPLGRKLTFFIQLRIYLLGAAGRRCGPRFCPAYFTVRHSEAGLS